MLSDPPPARRRRRKEGFPSPIFTGRAGRFGEGGECDEAGGEGGGRKKREQEKGVRVYRAHSSAIHFTEPFFRAFP